MSDEIENEPTVNEEGPTFYWEDPNSKQGYTPDYAAEFAEEEPLVSDAERIRELMAIDQDIVKLIHSAGLAVQALTNAEPEGSTSSTAANGSIQSHKKQFEEATKQYFALLSSIDVGLRRQVYAAEEAGLPPTEEEARAFDSWTTGSATGSTTGSDTASVITSVSLDSVKTGWTTASAGWNVLNKGWLNTRKDPLNLDKEAELLVAARAFMEMLVQSGALQALKVQNGEDEKMQVD